MSEPVTHRNLLAAAGAGPSPSLLPEIGPTVTDDASHAELVAAVVAEPAGSRAWAQLAEEALAVGTSEADVTAYAYARTGYHRGLDALRRSGGRVRDRSRTSTVPTTASSAPCGHWPGRRDGSATRWSTNAARSSCEIPPKPATGP